MPYSDFTLRLGYYKNIILYIFCYFLHLETDTNDEETNTSHTDDDQSTWNFSFFSVFTKQRCCGRVVLYRQFLTIRIVSIMHVFGYNSTLFVYSFLFKSTFIIKLLQCKDIDKFYWKHNYKWLLHTFILKWISRTFNLQNNSHVSNNV